MASIDGIGEVHDSIRGVRGALALASETLNSLLELRQEYPNYFVGLKMTILPGNVDFLSTILDFTRTRGIFQIISPVFFSEGRFRNAEKSKILSWMP